MLSSIYRRTGYLFADDRGSGGALEEADILTCPHCQCILYIKKTQTEGDACRRCNAPICEACAKRMPLEGCVPFRKLVDEAIEREVRDQAYRRALGF